MKRAGSPARASTSASQTALAAWACSSPASRSGRRESSGGCPTPRRPRAARTTSAGCRDARPGTCSVRSSRPARPWHNSAARSSARIAASSSAGGTLRWKIASDHSAVDSGTGTRSTGIDSVTARWLFSVSATLATSTPSATTPRRAAPPRCRRSARPPAHRGVHGTADPIVSSTSAICRRVPASAASASDSVFFGSAASARWNRAAAYRSALSRAPRFAGAQRVPARGRWSAPPSRSRTSAA